MHETAQDMSSLKTSSLSGIRSAHIMAGFGDPMYVCTDANLGISSPGD